MVENLNPNEFEQSGKPVWMVSHVRGLKAYNFRNWQTLLHPIGSPKLASKCLLGWITPVGQVADLYKIFWDDESRCLWVMVSPTCSPNPTQ